EVKRQGHKVLYLNVGDPNIFDFAPPAHVIEAAYRAMRDNKNGYAPSAGVPEALDAIRGEAAKNGISTAPVKPLIFALLRCSIPVTTCSHRVQIIRFIQLCCAKWVPSRILITSTKMTAGSPSWMTLRKGSIRGPKPLF